MQTMVSVMKALADRNRFRVVAVLQTHAELCACQITELLQVTGATVSRHMGILVRAGLVESRKEGRWTYFRLKTDPPSDCGPVLKWLREGAEQSGQGVRDGRALIQILSLDKEALCRRQRGEACCPLPGRPILNMNVQSKERRS
jgi:ArsR family transcriptional regulator, arsenate/arsenite/antimonite-responsive transcriptional repressor